MNGGEWFGVCGVGSARDTNGDINTPWSRSEEEVVTTKVALPAREAKSWSVHKFTAARADGNGS